MYTSAGNGGSGNWSAKVRNLSLPTKVDNEQDKENARDDHKCAGLSEVVQLSELKHELAVASLDGNRTCRTVAELKMRMKQPFQHVDKEGQLVTDQVHPGEIKNANYSAFEQLHFADNLSSSARDQEHVKACCDGLEKETGDFLQGQLHTTDRKCALPDVEKDINDSSLDAIMASKEKSREGCCSTDTDSWDTSASAPEDWPHCLPLALGKRVDPAELELDRLSQQVQLLVHQLAGCRQNLLRAEVEVGVLHEENRELRCIIRDLLASSRSSVDQT